MKSQADTPGIACILAAGNQFVVVIRDILQQLVVNNNACIVKLNPVNDWIGTDLEKTLQPLIDAGVLRLVYGATATAQVLSLNTLHSLTQLCACLFLSR